MSTLTQKIGLDRAMIAELYCHCREAAGSIHRLIDPANSFAAFIAYHDPAKVGQIKSMDDCIMSLLPYEASTVRVTADQLSAGLPASSFFRWVFGSAVAKWRSQW